jgi:hypothetical protein
MKMTIELSQAEVEKAVKFYLEKAEDMNVKNVSLEIGTEWVGYGMQETQVMKFKCAKVEVEK